MSVAPATAQTRDEIDRGQRKGGVAIGLGVQERWRDRQVDEVERWAKLGAAVVHGVYGQKGPWPDNWPRLAHRETWDASRQAVKRGPSNLAVRLGETADGHHLAHVDLDGKCPCGSDLADHDDEGRCLSEKCRTTNGCTCLTYQGVAPDVGLAKLLALLPEDVCVIKTGRGYRVLFFTSGPIAESVLPEFGADVAAYSGRLSIIPQSRHPGGQEYVYLRPPGDCLPLVDLEKLGLFPKPKGATHCRVGGRTGRQSSWPARQGRSITRGALRAADAPGRRLRRLRERERSAGRVLRVSMAPRHRGQPARAVGVGGLLLFRLRNGRRSPRTPGDERRDDSTLPKVTQ